MDDIKAGDRVRCAGEGAKVFRVEAVGKDSARIGGASQNERLHNLTKVGKPPWAFNVVDRAGNVIDWFEDRLSADRYVDYWNKWEANPLNLKRLSVQAV